MQNSFYIFQSLVCGCVIDTVNSKNYSLKDEDRCNQSIDLSCKYTSYSENEVKEMTKKLFFR